MKSRGTICGIWPHMRAAGLREAASGFAIWSVSAIMLASVLSGCRKDLCYDHDHWKVNVVPEWELAWERDYGRDWKTDWDSPAGYAYDDLRPSPGNGLAAFVYDGNGHHTERHIAASGGELPVGEGHRSVLLYNDDTEYIVFSSMDSYAEASAATRTRTRASYAQNHGAESTVNSPDMLFGSWIEDIMIEGTPGVSLMDLPMTLRPLVYKYVIVYRFESGIEHVRQARGALAGMAESVYLRNGHTGPEKVTVLFDDARIDAERSEVSAVVSTFGVPDYPDKYYQGLSARDVPDVFGLNLEVMLPDGSLKSFEFDISGQMADQPRGGVIEVEGLTVSEDEFGSGGAFDVEVGGWGDYEDIVLPL